MKLTICEDLTVPAKYEVCSRCHGTGEHDCFEGGFTNNVDQDFLEDYYRGVYTITCKVCKGKRVELVPDYDAMDDHTKKLVEEWYADMAAHYREVEGERRAGC